jgi:hypothetical protein
MFVYVLILKCNFFDMNIEKKVLDDQKIMFENYFILNEYHEIAQEVEILLLEQCLLNFDCHQLFV